MNHLQKVISFVKFPCYYDPGSQWILDQEGKVICDVRGWGWISNRAENTNEAMQMQDSLGETICELINTMK